MKTWKWLKDKAAWILGLLLIALGVLFAVKYERQKIEIAKLKIAESLKSVAENDTKIEVLTERDEVLAEMEGTVKEEMDTINERLTAVKEKVGERNATEVADRFNALYGPTATKPPSKR